MRANCIPSTIHRAINTIVLHCSATPSGQWLGGKSPLQPGYRTAPSIIDGWHADRKFARLSTNRSAFNYRLTAIGYHWVIDLDGNIWTGRHPDELGAHIAGHNQFSLGICLVGGAELNARYTAEQWASVAELVTGLRTLLGTRVAIVGHRDLSPDKNGDGRITSIDWLKTCPGFDVKAWLDAGMQPRPEQLIGMPR